jgi:PKD repeat protein
MTNNRAEAARQIFTDHEDFTEVFITSDSLGFEVESTAAGHAATHLGNARTDYISVKPADLEVIDDIEDATTEQDVDDIIDAVTEGLEEGEEVKTWIQEFADGKKAEIVEAARVAAKLIVITESERTTELELMTHGEEDQDVLDAIDDRIAALSDKDEPEASFTYVATGLSVEFTDTSKNDPSSWSWRFEPGISGESSLQNPTHIFSGAGTYTVALTATNAAGSDQASVTITVAP